MKNLSHQDIQALLSALEVLHAEVDPLTLPERTLQAVFSLVPNEMLVFDGFGTDNNYSGYLWYSPPGTVTEEKVQTLTELIHEHPSYQDNIVNRIQKTTKISQYIPLSKFHQTALYNEFYRHIGGESQMTTTLSVSSELFITCSLHRAKRDFTDRDLEVLKILSPHLVSAFRHAQFIHRLEFERGQLETALEATRHGIITVDMDLNIQSQNPTAIKLLHKYFHPPSSNLPDELLRYVRHHRNIFLAPEIFLPPAPLEVGQSGSKLKIRLTFQSQSNTIVLLLEEIKEAAPADLIGLGLTRREAEILFLIAKGKADADIAALCYISLRTVHKHRENIFRKLGVETRTAAMLRTIEFFEKVF